MSKLDTLAQLSTKTILTPKKEGYIGVDKKGCSCQDKFQRKAKAKAITNSVVMQLVDVKGSDLTKSYWQSYHCNNVQLQEDGKITSRYCNQRWCIVCSRVRTAKMINGYMKPLSELKNPYFVTLTIPNVKGNDLKTSIEDMTKSMTRIRKNIAKTYGTKIVGIRKTECTYNSFRNDYHPHFHLIVDGKDTAYNLVSLWLRQYPKATMKAQDVRRADNNSMQELFKYFTKVVNKDKFYPKQMDIVFTAMYGKRVFQPMGIKKDVSEDIDDIIAQEINFKPPQKEVWVYEPQHYDWVSAYGETLTDYTPTTKELDYLDKINNHKKILTYEQTKDKQNSFEINTNRKTKIESNTRFRKQKKPKSSNKKPNKQPLQQTIFKDTDFRGDITI